MKVLAAIDANPTSQTIIDALVGIGWVDGTEIHIVTIASDDPTHQQPLYSAEYEAIELMAADLQETLRHCQVFFKQYKGDPKHEIVSLAEQLEADLVVVGSNHKTGIEKILVGSVSQAVLNTAPCPVLICWQGHEQLFDLQRGFKRVLLAVDDSAFSKAAIQWLASFRWSQDTSFVLAGVVESVSAGYSDANAAAAARIISHHEDVFEAAKVSLTERARTLSQLLGTNRVEIDVTTGTPHLAILDLADSYNADLIVMGSHGRTGLQKMILGSVSQAVSEQAPCSVVVVRGILEKDESWQRTGVFKKPKSSGNVNRPKPKNDHVPHVFPGGMG